MLRTQDCLLLLVDVQEKLLPVMHEAEPLLASLQRLLAGAAVLGLPVVVSEQIPDKLGPTVAPLQALTTGAPTFAKQHFSCLGAPALRRHLEEIGRNQVLLAGIETHVCVYQTAVELMSLGYEVHIIADAVSSRTLRNCDLALARLQQEGVRLSSVEMALLELQELAGNDSFRLLLKIIR